MQVPGCGPAGPMGSPFSARRMAQHSGLGSWNGGVIVARCLPEQKSLLKTFRPQDCARNSPGHCPARLPRGGGSTAPGGALPVTALRAGGTASPNIPAIKSLAAGVRSSPALTPVPAPAPAPAPSTAQHMGSSSSRPCDGSCDRKTPLGSEEHHHKSKKGPKGGRSKVRRGGGSRAPGQKLMACSRPSRPMTRRSANSSLPRTSPAGSEPGEVAHPPHPRHRPPVQNQATPPRCGSRSADAESCLTHSTPTRPQSRRESAPSARQRRHWPKPCAHRPKRSGSR